MTQYYSAAWQYTNERSAVVPEMTIASFIASFVINYAKKSGYVHTYIRKSSDLKWIDLLKFLAYIIHCKIRII